MAAPRLPFLWPVLFKPLKGATARATPRISPKCSRRSERVRHLSVTARNTKPSPQRYGKATEPDPSLLAAEQEAQSPAPSKPSRTGDPSSKTTTNPSKPPVKPPKQETLEEHEEEEDDENAEPPKTLQSSVSPPPNVDPPELKTPPPDPPRMPDGKPLDTVLHMPSPQEEEARKPPHLKTPPYVHHFDTYSLVKQLTAGGYTPEQAVTTMKAVRGLLTDNISLARASLVSKSNVENETYLFRAACSELRIEVQNARKAAVEKMRTERNQLQHEVDILSQRLGQETSHLKDELKGLFDDRKMAVRTEQRSMESKIQELNYKITVALNSDARSEIEGLRWIVTRRAAIAIGVSAFMLFLALKYSSHVQHQNQLAEKKKEEAKKKKKESGDERDGGDGSSKRTGPSPVSAQEPLGGELLATEGGVSLG